jgi:hypothetical protein
VSRGRLEALWAAQRPDHAQGGERALEQGQRPPGEQRDAQPDRDHERDAAFLVEREAPSAGVLALLVGAVLAGSARFAPLLKTVAHGAARVLVVMVVVLGRGRGRR